MRSRASEVLPSEYAIVSRRRERDSDPSDILGGMRLSLEFVQLMLHGSSCPRVVETLDDIADHMQRLERALENAPQAARALHSAPTVRAVRKAWCPKKPRPRAAFGRRRAAKSSGVEKEETSSTVLRGRDIHLSLTEEPGEGRANAFFVVDDEDADPVFLGTVDHGASTEPALPWAPRFETMRERGASPTTTRLCNLRAAPFLQHW